MIKQIDFLNSTMVNLNQSSNSGSAVIDAGRDAILANKIAHALRDKISVEVVDVDDLKSDFTNEQMLLINQKVIKIAEIIPEKLPENYLIINDADLTKVGFDRLINRIKEQTDNLASV